MTPYCCASRTFPVVSRSVLHMLDALDPGFVQVSAPRWTVTHLPELRTSHRSACLSQPSCRFLFPVRIAEQESKARIHLAQLIQLASNLDRVLVLPQVDHSRLGACLGQRFETYYDAQQLHALYGPNLISLKQFRLWMRKRTGPTGAQLVSLKSAYGANGTTIGPVRVSVEQEVRYGSLPSCMRKRFPLLELEPPQVVVYPVHSGHEDQPPIGKTLANLFSLHTADVLVVDYDMRHAIFQDWVPLKYSADLHALAAEQVPQAPFIAVHWRMETAQAHVLPECAQRLIDTLAGQNLSVVWFATDYPDHNSTRKSQTFKTLTRDHQLAIKTFSQAFDKGGRLEHMTLKSLEGDYHDSGIRGIVDKLVMVQAEVVISGGKDCSRRQSSYTKQIVDTIRDRDGTVRWEMF